MGFSLDCKAIIPILPLAAMNHVDVSAVFPVRSIEFQTPFRGALNRAVPAMVRRQEAGAILNFVKIMRLHRYSWSPCLPPQVSSPANAEGYQN